MVPIQVLTVLAALAFTASVLAAPQGPTHGDPLAPATAPAAPAAHPVERREDLRYAEGLARDGRRNLLDLYLPKDVTKPPLLMFVHGGGWSVGSKDRYAYLGEAVAASGIACAVINTQLHPFATPHAMVVDCAAALGWLHAHAAEHGFDGDALFLMGHSSGGHLAAWLALDGARLDAVGVPRGAVRGVIGLSGVYDVRPGNVVLDRIFTADAAERVAASPVAHVAEGAPPFLVFWAQHEMPGLELSARVLVRALVAHGTHAQGVVLPHKGHLDYVLEIGRERDLVLPKVLEFVAARRGGAPAKVAVLQTWPIVEQRGVQLDAAGPTVDAWSPAHDPQRLLVLAAVGEAERAACEALGKALAPHGVLVVVVPSDATALQPPAASRAFAGAVQRVRAWHKPGTNADLVPHVGGLGVGAWVASLGELPVHGRILFGAPVGRASLQHLMPAAKGDPNARDASAAFGPRSAPLLVVAGSGDGPAMRADTEAFALRMLAPGATSLGLVLTGTTSALALLHAGEPADQVVPLVLAFLGL